ncbi:MAG: hypothetical protein AAGB07_17400 [Pseudomonadota bacterium]
MRALLCLVLALPTTTARGAEIYPLSELAQRKADLRRDIELTVWNDILLRLNDDTRRRLRDISIDITLRDETFPDAPPHTAYAVPATKTIELPIESLHFWGDMGLVFAWFEHRGCDLGYVSSYLYQIGNRLTATPPMDAFALDRDTLIAVDFVDTLSQRITTTAFNFILAHEMGHLFVSTFGPTSDFTSLQHETMADLFAMEAMASRNLPPLGMNFFFFGTRFLPQRETPQGLPSHPPTAERIETIARIIGAQIDRFVPPDLQGVKRELNRAQLRSFLSDMGKLAAWMRDGTAHDVLVENLPRVYPAHRLSTACPV